MAFLRPKLSELVGAGFPRDLLIPIVPGDFEPTERINEKMVGKAPAVFGRWGWNLVHAWQTGVAEEAQLSAEAAGCNWGIRLGEAGNGMRFLFFDIDTEPDIDPKLAVDIQKAVLSALTAALGVKALWVRFTRPGRLGFLVRIPANESPGAKSKLIMSTPDGTPIGAIELLARGQQAVIAGVHSFRGGTQIRWIRTDQPSQVTALPSIDEGLPSIVNRESVGGLVELLRHKLETAFGINFEAQGRTPTDASSDRAILDTGRRAPWSVKDFIDTLNRCPHPEDMTRDDFVAFMLACSGAIQAAQQMALAGLDEIEAMVDATVGWASRWGGQEGTHEAAQEAWDRDFGRRIVVSVGWPQIVEKAIAYGLEDLRSEQAKRVFADSLPPEPIVRRALAPRMPTGEDLPLLRRQQRLRFDTKTSDIQIADAVQDRIKDFAAWVENERQWIAWSGTARGWAHPEGARLVRTWIEDELVRYVDRYSDDIGDSEDVRSRLTSAARINAIEHILRTRLGVQLSEVDKGELVLQTPAGALDLRSSTLLAPAEQKALLERRCTFYSPKAGAMPLFDDLLRHLACGDQEVVDWLWAYFGYMLLGNPLAHVMLVIFGPGGNGKSRLASILRVILGSYASQIDRRVLLASGKDDHPTALWEMRGKRMWVVGEFQPNEDWNESQVRALTGGDPIKARGMRMDIATFMPEGAFLITTNFTPSFHRIDAAVVRRIRMLNARLAISKEKIDLRFETKVLTQEAPAILARLIEEARMVLDNNYQLPDTPAVMQYEAKAYFSEQDQFHVWFMSECEVVADTSQVHSLDTFYQRYQRYVKRSSLEASADSIPDIMSITAFYAAIAREGASTIGKGGRLAFSDERGNTSKGVAGVRLRLAAA